MKKKSKKRRSSKKKNQRKSSSYSDLNISKLNHHKRQGRKLSPPMNQIPNSSPSSWANDHMPEMLWAVLLTSVFERKEYLICFRVLASICRPWFLKEDQESEVAPSTQEQDEEMGLNVMVVADLTKLSEVTDEQFNEFLKPILDHPQGIDALRPLLLIEGLPGLERWKKVLNVAPKEEDWETLARAVSKVLDHQSEASTDIRWFKLIIPIISGRMLFPESFKDRLEELRLFPDKGDMRSVRPFIRSGEMMLRRSPPSKWIDKFWKESLDKTGCIDPSVEADHSLSESKISPDSLYDVRGGVIERFLKCTKSTSVDARLDTSFGLVLYALSIIEEIGGNNLQDRIMGRLALRAIVESNITLRYLVKKNQDEMWKSFRVFGAGQAKLAFLKVQEAEGDIPPFMDEDTLYNITNEDIWQEFLDIDIGHWAKSNLRKLAIECNSKELYDKYYDWSSTYTHSHWGAIRDTNFVTCHNPLHRLHRIPRLLHRSLNSVDNDVVSLVNEMLETLDDLYPDKKELKRLSLSDFDKTSESEDT